MERSRFTEEHIIGVLKEAVAGAKTAELVREKIAAWVNNYKAGRPLTSRSKRLLGFT